MISLMPRLLKPSVVFGLTLLVAQEADAQRRLTQAGPSTKVRATERFEFYSDPWINLHHFLYQWAREDLGLGTGRRYVHVAERASLATMPTEQRTAWSSAVAFYRDSVARAGHFDVAMRRLKRDLVGLAGDLSAVPPDHLPGIGVVLRTAMPVYLERWWPQHDSLNRAWISSVAPRLGRHEESFVELTKRLYGARWPDTPWRVDVSAYANPRGGYTTLDGHVVIYAGDRGVQDLYGLEMVLHEIQHATAIGGSVDDALSREFEAVGAKPAPNLSHALIFATAGQFTKQIAALEQQRSYTPYWIKEGFETLDGWSALVPVVQEKWVPAVRGEISSREGLAALARALGRP
jgi:hypothetical protein